MSNGPAVQQYGPGDTTQIGGSRFPFWDSQGLLPSSFGPVLENAAYAVPSVPPNYGDASLTGAPDANAASAMSASAAPFSLQQSPLLWVLIALVGGLFATHRIAWKGE